MEHIIVTNLGEYVKLTAESGYALYSLVLERVVSEAVVKPENADKFKAVAL